MKIHIKYMVSLRCKMIVVEELRKLNIPFTTIELGVAEISQVLTPALHETLKANLLRYGLALLDDKRSILIEQIKAVIIEMIHYSDELPTVNHSDYIAEKLGYEFPYLSKVFTEVKGMTIRQFIILHKIEKVKELLLYDELNLSEISYKLHYSSISHLSNQFKKVTGLSPSYYKQMKHKRQLQPEIV